MEVLIIIGLVVWAWDAVGTWMNQPTKAELASLRAAALADYREHLERKGWNPDKPSA